MGRPKIKSEQKRDFVGIRLATQEKDFLSQLGKGKGVGAGVRLALEQLIIWQKVEKKIKTKIRDHIKNFVEHFAIFVKANKSNYDNIKQVKKEVVGSAKDLYFLSGLLDDDHEYLKDEIGHIHFTGLKEVWRVVKIDKADKQARASRARKDASL